MDKDEIINQGELQILPLLFEISRELSEAVDLKITLASILGIIAGHWDMIRGTLTIVNRETGEIFIDEAFGLLPEQQARGKYLPGEGITGKVIETGNPVVIPRIADSPDFLDRTGSRKNLDKSDIAFICVPIKNGNEVIGALSSDRVFKDNLLLDNDLKLFTIIASMISQAVRLRQLASEELVKLKEENRRLNDELKIMHSAENMIGNSRGMKSVQLLINTVSRTSTTVLILGESGVGKEKVARAIHYSSERGDKPFVAVNCAALPESLIESELFGHEKGAFTGAVNARKGFFERAGDGTLFLDEIGELPLHLQTRLLRVIQEREVTPLGGCRAVKVNARLIAATNRDLENLMKEGKFREDLYYRLNVFPIAVPPLRDRRADILQLAEFFTEKYSNLHGKNIDEITVTAKNLLLAYNWPGNVRELENCIERAVILCRDGIIQSYHLPPGLGVNNELEQRNNSGLRQIMDGIEKEIIIEELIRSGGNMASAARSLGISERIMGLRVKSFLINIEDYKKKE